MKIRFVSLGVICVFSLFLAPTLGFSSNVTVQGDYFNSLPPGDRDKINLELHHVEDVRALLPTRLAFATFAAQNGYLAAAQVVTDHLDQKRFVPQRRWNPKADSKMAAGDPSIDDLLVDRSDQINSNTKVPQASCHSQGFVTGWLGAFGEYAHEKLQPDVAAFSFNVGGAVLGVDYNCVNDDVIGLGGSYVYTHVDEDADAGHANLNQGVWGLYSMLHVDEWYFDLSMWGGYYHTDNVRHIPSTQVITAESKTHGWQLAPHAEIGYEGYLSNVCREKWFGVGPFVLADWVANWEHGFSEHGAGIFNMHQKGKFCSLFRGETGIRFHEIVSWCWGNVVFQQKGSYAYQKMFGTGTVTAFLASIPGSSFTTHTLTGAQNLGVFEFSILFKPVKQCIPYVDFRYQGEFGSRYQSHQGIVEIGKDF